MRLLLPLPILSIALSTTIALSGCSSMPGTRIDNIPMYGQPEVERPEVLKRADEEFIKKAVEGFGSRENASKAWVLQGDQYMSEGNLDYAMRRYNQAWLLDPNSFMPYWGFGRALLQLGKVDEALKHFAKANELVDDPYQKVALLSDTGSAYSEKGSQTSKNNLQEGARYFALANKYFEESIQMDPNYPNSWRRWAASLYFEGRYAEAWEKVKKARALGATKFTQKFIKALEEKMPEPK